MFSSKGNVLYLLYSTVGESPASDNAKLSKIAENISVNSNLDDSGISLPFFPSRTNLKLHNISITPKMVRKVELLNKCLKESCFPDC